MSETPYPVPDQKAPQGEPPEGEESETEDEHSIVESNVDYSQSSGRSESEKDTNGTSGGRITGESGSEISDGTYNKSGEALKKIPERRTKTSELGARIEEHSEEEEASLDFAHEEEDTIVTLNINKSISIDSRDRAVESQLPERPDQPGRALRSKGAALPVQLGARDAAERITAAAWISRSAGTYSTIPRGEERKPGHRRQRYELDIQSKDGSLKTLTVGQEDDASTPLPRRGVEQSQREPSDWIGISGAASGRDSPRTEEEQGLLTPNSVRRLTTSLGREICQRTDYQVVEQTETPRRDPRTLVIETALVARKLQFREEDKTEEATKERIAIALVEEFTEEEHAEEHREQNEEELLDREVEKIFQKEVASPQLDEDGTILTKSRVDVQQKQLTTPAATAGEDEESDQSKDEEEGQGPLVIRSKVVISPEIDESERPIQGEETNDRQAATPVEREGELFIETIQRPIDSIESVKSVEVDKSDEIRELPILNKEDGEKQEATEGSIKHADSVDPVGTGEWDSVPSPAVQVEVTTEVTEGTPEYITDEKTSENEEGFEIISKEDGTGLEITPVGLTILGVNLSAIEEELRRQNEELEGAIRDTEGVDNGNIEKTGKALRFGFDLTNIPEPQIPATVIELESGKESEGQSGEPTLEEAAGGQERRAAARAEKHGAIAEKSSE